MFTNPNSIRLINRVQLIYFRNQLNKLNEFIIFLLIFFILSMNRQYKIVLTKIIQEKINLSIIVINLIVQSIQ